MIENTQDQILLAKAITIAVEAHKFDVDKANNPYIEHPLRVMLNVVTYPEKIAAVLHDVFEDHVELSINDLSEQGFSDEVIEAIKVLTIKKDESYSVYINRIIDNPISLKVKIADMRDNMNISRIPNPTPKDYLRLEKYQKIFPVLLKAEQAQNSSLVSLQTQEIMDL